MSLKLTKEKREKLRKLRKLWQNVFERINEKNFQYIIQRQPPGKICFGSCVERQCLPVKGPAKTPLMRRFIPDGFIDAGPGTYEIKTTLIKKYPNKEGYAGLAYKTPRTALEAMSLNPPVGAYELTKVKSSKQAAKPFYIGAKFTRKDRHITPAPGTYQFRKRNLLINEGFGKQRINLPSVRIICTPRNFARCCICEEVPLGDYWRYDPNKQDMCRPCMQKQRYETNMTKSKNKKMKRLAEFDKFVRVRYCGIYHEHGGTQAALSILSKRHVNIKHRTENYLAMFHY